MIYEHFQKGRLNNIICNIGVEPITVTCEVWIPDRTGHWYAGNEPDVSIVELVIINQDYNNVTNISHHNLYSEKGTVSSFFLQVRQLNLTKKCKVLNKLIKDGLVNKNKEDPGRKGRGNSP